MFDAQLYLYKVPPRFEILLNEIGLSFSIVPDLHDFNVINKGVVMTPVENFSEDSYFLCRLAMITGMENIGIYGEQFSTADKEMLYESGVKYFVREDADSYDLLSVLPCRKSLPSDQKQDTMVLPDTLINKISLPIFIKDNQCRFVACNDAFCMLLERNRDEILNQTSQLFFSSKKAQIYEEVDKMVMESGQDRQHPVKFLRKDNTLHETIVKKSALYSSEGDINGLIGIITDITELKQREKDLKKEKSKAKTSDKLKTSFLSNMSHEIRTPMNAIVGFSQLLTTPNLNDDRKKVYVDQINYNAAQLLKLIEDIIEVSKIEAGKVKTSIGKCYVNQLLDEIYISFEAHKGILGKTGVELKLNKSKKENNFIILTDQYRLNQIITNLLGNALKFTDSGYVEFGYTEQEYENESVLEFYVKDTGLGINQDKLPYVFDRFSKIPATKTRLYGGTGIGLSISKSLVELLGGRIFVESQENEGTTFYFTIPLRTNSDIGIEEEHEKAVLKSPVEKLYNWSGKRILIAEDEEMNYLYLQEVLKVTNVQVVWKQDGAKAVEEIRKDNKYDAVLMDVKMPVMDGYEATKIIKTEQPQIPIIIQTAYAMKVERDKGFAAGCDEYIEKPVNRDILLGIIQDYFNRLKN